MLVVKLKKPVIFLLLVAIPVARESAWRQRFTWFRLGSVTWLPAFLEGETRIVIGYLLALIEDNQVLGFEFYFLVQIERGEGGHLHWGIKTHLKYLIDMRPGNKLEIGWENIWKGQFKISQWIRIVKPSM